MIRAMFNSEISREGWRGLCAALALAAAWVGAPPSASAGDGPAPVLMVISNQDFYYREYGETRQSLEAAGLEVVVAAATTETAEGGHVSPDLALADAKAEDYSAIVFVGGWGSAQYQYAFEGTYSDSAYSRDRKAAAAASQLIAEMLEKDAHVAAICHGVSVLAWARVDGVSPLAGRIVVGSAMLSPGFELGGVKVPPVPSRWHVEENGGAMLASGSVGDPQTAADDVFVDGKIITAEDFRAARAFARALAKAVSN